MQRLLWRIAQLICQIYDIDYNTASAFIQGGD